VVTRFGTITAIGTSREGCLGPSLRNMEEEKKRRRDEETEWGRSGVRKGEVRDGR
jgi:hypothetical protein